MMLTSLHAALLLNKVGASDKQEHSRPYAPPPTVQATPSTTYTSAPGAVHPFPKSDKFRFKPLSPLPLEDETSQSLLPPPGYQANAPIPYYQTPIRSGDVYQPVQQGTFPRRTLQPLPPQGSQQQAPAMVREGYRVGAIRAGCRILK